MAALEWRKNSPGTGPISQQLSLAVRERNRRKQMVSAVLLVIVIFQLINVPGALVNHSSSDFITLVLGLSLCGVAFILNRLEKLTVVALLLIAVIDLGCGVMLFAMPMGLDVMDLPIFDILLISELIAVSLLPPMSVFVVAACNILFIFLVIIIRPHTDAFSMMLMSNMAYDTLAQPIGLQIVVAVVSFIWVRSALDAIKRADRAEEIADLRQRESDWKQREVEQKMQLDIGVEHLSGVLNDASNGQRNARAQLPQEHVLWRLANALNLLLVRVSRVSQIEDENKRLRMELIRTTETLYETRRSLQRAMQQSRQTDQLNQQNASGQLRSQSEPGKVNSQSGPIGGQSGGLRASGSLRPSSGTLRPQKPSESGGLGERDIRPGARPSPFSKRGGQKQN